MDGAVDFQAGHEYGEGQVGARLVEGASLTGALAGAGAVVLAILGLVGILPVTLAAIAAIAVGVALLAHGSAIAAGFARLMGKDYMTAHKEVSSGLSAEALAGIAGIVLGILALIRIEPLILLGAANIALGGAMLMGSGSIGRLEESVRSATRERSHETPHQAVYAGSGVEALAGIGAAVLGILSLVGILPVVLNLVGFLALGAATLFSGSAVASRVFSVFE